MFEISRLNHFRIFVLIFFYKNTSVSFRFSVLCFQKSCPQNRIICTTLRRYFNFYLQHHGEGLQNFWHVATETGGVLEKCLRILRILQSKTVVKLDFSDFSGSRIVFMDTPFEFSRKELKICFRQGQNNLPFNTFSATLLYKNCKFLVKILNFEVAIAHSFFEQRIYN